MGTIKGKLFGLTICGLLFIAGVSITGYWGITSVENTTAAVAATGSAIRNHIEAGVYNDTARADVSAVFTAKGDEQQNKVEEFNQHCKLLQDRIGKAGTWRQIRPAAPCSTLRMSWWVGTCKRASLWSTPLCMIPVPLQPD